MNSLYYFLQSRSKLAILCAAIIYCMVFFNITRYDGKGNGVFTEDMLIYYSYLPATFIEHDLSFKFLENPDNTNISWTLTTSEGKRVVKFTMGVAVLQTPFFLLAQCYSIISNGNSGDGFTLPYQILIGLSGLFYCVLGLIYIRKILIFYVDDLSTSLTILGIALGTNLFYYATHETIMSHSFSFCFASILIYHTIRWHENGQWKNGLSLAFALGILILIRPTNILMALIPLLYGSVDLESLIVNFKKIRQHAWQLLTMLLLVIMLYLPQLFYWKFATGHWFYYSYQTETFHLNNPHIIDTLFGFRKGLFIYTPFMILLIPGLFFTKRYAPKFIYLIPVYSLISIYIISSWWCWWYGGSLGLRAYIESFPLWCLPIAFTIQYLIKKSHLLYKLTMAATLMFILYQSLQIFQYRGSLIHYDSMTFKAWKAIQFRITKPNNYEKLLQTPQPDDTIYPEKLKKKNKNKEKISL